MSHNYPCTWKVCATCAYWMGTRKTDRFGIRCEVESTITKGKCMGPSGWRNMERQAYQNCLKFKKWEVLK